MQEVRRKDAEENSAAVVINVETAVRRLGMPVCRCGYTMMLTGDGLYYYCGACGRRLTRAEMKRLEFKEDAKAFM